MAAVTGEIYKMELDGTILGKFGHAGKELGRVQYGARTRLPESPTRSLVAEITSWRVQKIFLHPAAEGRKQ